MYGEAAYGEAAYAESVDNVFYEKSKFRKLLDDPELKRIHLLTLTPYDPATAGEVTLRYADTEYRTEPADSPSNAEFEARLVQPFSYQASLFRNNQVLSEGSSSFGVIELVNTDGGLDDLVDYTWDGRDVELKLGGTDFDHDEFQVVFQGKSETLTWDEHRLTLRIRDPRNLLDKKIQDNLYAGTGNDEGGDGIKGRPKPLLYGHAREIRPVEIDTDDRIYQIHDGSIEAVEAVYDEGSEDYTFAGDTTNLRGTSVSSGQYITDLSTGRIKLGNDPSGTLTVDAKGDNTGGYVSSAADIIERIVKNHSTLTASDIDSGSFSQLNSDNSAVVGMFVGDRQRRLPSVITELTQSIGGWWVFLRDGTLAVGQFKEPGRNIAHVFDKTDLFGGRGISRRSPGRVVSLVRLGYDRTWTTQSRSQLNDALSTSEKDLRANEYRYVTSEDSSVETAHLLAQDIERTTLIDTSTAAQTEADRILSLVKIKRNIYEINLGWRLFDIDLNDTVEITYDRFGLMPKQKFRVIGIEESVAGRSVRIQLWG